MLHMNMEEDKFHNQGVLSTSSFGFLFLVHLKQLVYAADNSLCTYYGIFREFFISTTNYRTFVPILRLFSTTS